MATQSPQDRYVRVGPLNIRYWCEGDAGSPLLLIHGIGSSMEDWRREVFVLAERHRVYALDLPGFGFSDKPAVDYTLDFFGDAIPAFLQTQGIAKASLVGHSLGGTTALNCAIRYPDLVDKLILVDPGGLGRSVTIFFRLAAIPVLGDRLTRPTLKATEQLERSFYHNQAMVTPELIQFKYNLACQPGMQASVLRALRGNVNLFGLKSQVVRSIVDNLGRINAPTLVVWGRHDRALPVTQAEVVRQGIRDVRVEILEDGGHAVPMECSDALNALILDFLAARVGTL